MTARLESGFAAADVISASVAALVEGGIRSLAWAKAKMMALLMPAVFVAAGGASVVTHQVLGGKPAETEPEPPAREARKAQRGATRSH